MDSKKIFAIVLAVLVIIVAAAGFVYINYLTGPEPAVLKSYNGTVTVNGEPASSGQSLGEGDTIYSKEGGATIAFFGTSILRLDSQTKVVLEKLDIGSSEIAIEQKSGKTWSRVVKKIEGSSMGSRVLGGVNRYELESPTAVASVRGTAFSVWDNGLSAVRGRIEVRTGEETEMVSNSTALTEEGVKVMELRKTGWMKENMRKDKKFDRKYLESMFEKYSFLMSYIESNYNITKKEMRRYVEENSMEKAQKMIMERMGAKSLSEAEEELKEE